MVLEVTGIKQMKWNQICLAISPHLMYDNYLNGAQINSEKLKINDK